MTIKHMPIKSIREAKNLSGKKVLVRVDFNVPMKNGRVVSDYKIVKSLPTIEFLIKKGACVILVSHLGRPKGKDPSLSLKPVAKRLEDLIQQRVGLNKIATKTDWIKLKEDTSTMPPGSVLMLENIRYLKEEEADATTLSKALASLADIFVLDGFAVAHRRASSVSGVAKYLPSYAGLLLFEEISVLSKVLKPKKPLVVLLAGAKVETKIPVLKNLLPRADHVLVGGGIFNTYLLAQGKKLGSSLASEEYAKEISRYGKNKKIIFPVDVIVGGPDGKKARIVKADDVRLNKGEAIYDIGPETVRNFASYIKKAKTLVWNGAFGMFEQHPYEYGTYSLVRLFASKSKGRALGVCGGGETVEILEHLKLMPEIDLVSTGGGALLEYLSGRKLPGIEALK